MLQERKRTTFLKKLNPNAKLWLALGLICAIILLKNLYFALAIMVGSIILIVHEKQIGLFKFILLTMVILFLAMYGIYGAIAPNINHAADSVVFHVFGIPYYGSGFAYAAKYYFRVAPLMCSLFLLFLSMDMTDLGVLMCNAGIPYHLVFTFIDSFQVIILLGKDVEQIRDAQRARGLNTEGSLIKRFRAFIPIMVPVVANSIIKVQDQAIAMDTKGFNSDRKKTVYRELEHFWGDSVIRAVGLVLAGGSILYCALVAVSMISPFFTNIL